MKLFGDVIITVYPCKYYWVHLIWAKIIIISQSWSTWFQNMFIYTDSKTYTGSITENICQNTKYLTHTHTFAHMFVYVGESLSSLKMQ